MIEERVCKECAKYTERSTLVGPWGHCHWSDVDMDIAFTEKKGWCLGFEELKQDT